jgi:hypothetical protein
MGFSFLPSPGRGDQLGRLERATAFLEIGQFGKKVVITCAMTTK